MAYAQQRITSSGTSRWYAMYFTADGRQRSGGGFSAKRDAGLAAIKLEQHAAAGTLADAARGKLTVASGGVVSQPAERSFLQWPSLQPCSSAASR